jgi:hypothetical protein
MNNRLILAWLVVVTLLSGCATAVEPSPSQSLPEPTCGGIKIKIEGAIPCADLARIAVQTIRERAPDQLAKGVAAIDVVLSSCPRDEIPPQVDCGTEAFAQLVTVVFAANPAGGPIEPSLTVVLAPVSGRVLGVVNPLIR